MFLGVSLPCPPLEYELSLGSRTLRNPSPSPTRKPEVASEYRNLPCAAPPMGARQRRAGQPEAGVALERETVRTPPNIEVRTAERERSTEPELL